MENMGNNLFKYIRKENNSYSIIKEGESFGTYSKLTDALYERDRLIKSDWDWEDSLELEETENLYEMMNLPKFDRDYAYVYRRVQTYKIFKDGNYLCSFNNKHHAYDYAEFIGGEIVESNISYRVQKRIDGIQKYFGEFKTLEEAKRRRDELMLRGWKDDKLTE